MVLAAVETVANADPVGASRRHNSDVAAQATAGEAVLRVLYVWIRIHGNSLTMRVIVGA